MHPTMVVVNLIMVATPTLSTMLESLNYYGCHTLVHHIDYIHRPRPRAFSSRQCSVSKHGCGLTHGFHAPLAKTWAWSKSCHLAQQPKHERGSTHNGCHVCTCTPFPPSLRAWLTFLFLWLPLSLMKSDNSDSHLHILQEDLIGSLKRLPIWHRKWLSICPKLMGSGFVLLAIIRPLGTKLTFGVM